MNCYNKNIDAIKTKGTNLLQIVNKNEPIGEIKNKLDDIESQEAKNGEKIVYITYKSEKHRLNSLYRPTEEASKWAKQFSFMNLNTIVNMFGFGNGIFVRELLKNMGDKDIILIYEPSYEIFMHVLERYNISDILLDKRVFIFVSNINEDEFRNMSSSVTNIVNINSQINCIYPYFDEIFAETAITFFKNLKDGLTSSIINTNTLISFAESEIENTFKNLSFFREGISLQELKKSIPKSVPAIVVAAGPSVEENIEELKKAKGRAVIFAVDRVLDYLLDSGVVPDFVVTVDSQKGLEYFSIRDKINVPLISYYESNYDILKFHTGRKIFCSATNYIDGIYNQVNKISPYIIPSGSVAIVAFSICVELGFKRIALVGQDLAYGGEKSHVGKITEPMIEGRDLYVQGIDGNEVKSRYDWKEFVLRYEDLINHIEDIEVIDTKTEGAKIKGAIMMSLQDVLNTYCNNGMLFNMEEVLGNIGRTFTDEEVDEVKEHLQRELDILKNIKKKSGIAIDQCNILLKENTNVTKKTKEALKELKKINKYIEKQKIYSIMDAYVTAKSTDELSNIYKFTDDVELDGISTFEKAKKMYENIIEAVDYVYPKLEKSIDRI